MKLKREHLDRAKQLLRAHLADHTDEGVRAVNEVAELGDNHPSVIKIATALAKDKIAAARQP